MLTRLGKNAVAGALPRSNVRHPTRRGHGSPGAPRCTRTSHARRGVGEQSWSTGIAWNRPLHRKWGNAPGARRAGDSARAGTVYSRDRSGCRLAFLLLVEQDAEPAPDRCKGLPVLCTRTERADIEICWAFSIPNSQPFSCAGELETKPDPRAQLSYGCQDSDSPSPPAGAMPPWPMELGRCLGPGSFTRLDDRPTTNA